MNIYSGRTQFSSRVPLLSKMENKVLKNLSAIFKNLKKGFFDVAANDIVWGILVLTGFVCCLIIPCFSSILGPKIPMIVSPILGVGFIFFCCFGAAFIDESPISISKFRTLGREFEKHFSGLADSYVICRILILIGFVCSLTIPYCFHTLGPTIPRFLSPILGVGFLLCSCFGMTFREESPFLRKPRPSRLIQFMFSLAWHTLSLVVSVNFDISTKGLIGFILTSIAIFCFIMVCQPSYDYGLLQAFSILPIAVLIARRANHWYPGYMPLGVMAGLFIGSQIYFVRIYDDRYALLQEAAKKQKQGEILPEPEEEEDDLQEIC